MEKLPIEIINSKIYTIHGKKVMLDRDLAELYQVVIQNEAKEGTNKIGFVK